MSTKEDLFYEELQVGDSWKSPLREIDESDIMGFANLTGDHDPLHVDPGFAANTPFRKQIAHGLLGLSFMAGLCSDHPRIKTTAFLRIENWSFLNPIFIGDSIYAENEVVGLDDHGRRHGVVHWQRRIKNAAGEIVQEGILVTLVARESPLKSIRIDSGHTEIAPARKTERTKSDKSS